MKTYFYQATGLLAAALILAACGSARPTTPAKPGVPAASIATQAPAQATAPTEAPAAGGESGGEGGGGEAALVTYADAAQGFAIDYPKPWTKDPAVKDGVKFDGDGTMTLALVKADTKDVMAFALANAKTFAASQPSFKQVGLNLSTEVQNAVVLGFETNGISNVTGKTYVARGDRYYIALKDGRIAVVTVISPAKRYDREGIRDITLTLKVTQSDYAPMIVPSNFVSIIDNPYFPLTTGTTFIYEGKTEKGTEHVEMAVSRETKIILGVTCVVVTDTVTVDGQLEEATVDWYAQDKQGNVWYFGEDTHEVKDGKILNSNGAWQAGVDGAQPGYIMRADPIAGDTYHQEYYKGEAEDMAQILSLSESVSVPLGSYRDVLMTKEWSALDPKIVDQKYYAKGIGFILSHGTQAASGSLKLVEIRHQ